MEQNYWVSVLGCDGLNSYSISVKLRFQFEAFKF